MGNLIKHTSFKNKNVVNYPYRDLKQALKKFLRYDTGKRISLNNNYLYPLFKIGGKWYFVLTNDEILEVQGNKSEAIDKIIFFGKTLFFFDYHTGLSFINNYLKKNDLAFI